MAFEFIVSMRNDAVETYYLPEDFDIQEFLRNLDIAGYNKTFFTFQDVDGDYVGLNMAYCLAYSLLDASKQPR